MKTQNLILAYIYRFLSRRKRFLQLFKNMFQTVIYFCLINQVYEMMEAANEMVDRRHFTEACKKLKNVEDAIQASPTFDDSAEQVGIVRFLLLLNLSPLKLITVEYYA